MVALRDLGHDVVDLDATPKSKRSLTERILRQIGYQFGTTRLNAQILDIFTHETPDLVWVDKTLSIAPATLVAIKRHSPSGRLLFYSPDDMMLPTNRSRQYQACLPLYDLHVTTKSYNVTELKGLGARSVLFVDNAFDPHTHRPLALSAEEQCRWQAHAGFVGGEEQDRYEMMLQLAKAGISVSVRGPGWDCHTAKHPNLIVEPGWITGDDYTRSICATEVNLGFLRKVARDLQTTRSIEIPACGGFMLAERTEEHLRLFEEGQEAEFFDSVEELIEKTRYYLAQADERERIARAGRERCLNSGYSNQERLSTVLAYLVSLPSI
jgi:hypothetical protein